MDDILRRAGDVSVMFYPDIFPRMTQGKLAVEINRRRELGGDLSMSAKVFAENSGNFSTIFSLYDNGQKFAELYQPGDYREDGSEASSVHACFKEFFKIQERGKE